MNKNNQTPTQPVAHVHGRVGQRRAPVVICGSQHAAAGRPDSVGRSGCPQSTTAAHRVVIPGRVAPRGTSTSSHLEAAPSGIPVAQSNCNEEKRVAPPVPWQHSQAKQHLAARFENPHDDIHRMTPEAIYNSSPLYQCFKKAAFKRNCQTLRSKIKHQRDLVEFDRQAVASLPARPLMTERGYPFWDGSEAQQILNLELTNGKNAGLQPQDVYLQNVEYQKFPLHVFRNHFYKTQSKKKSSAYWQLKRNKDAMRTYDVTLNAAKYGSC